MKIILIYLLLLLKPAAEQPIGPKVAPPTFEATVAKVVKAFQERDAATINALLPSDAGLVVVHRPGVLDYLTVLDTVDFARTLEPILPDYSAITYRTMVYEALPRYDCMAESWNKTGAFCDTATVNRQWSKTAENINFQEIGNIPLEEIERIERLEEKSRKVIIASADEISLMFSLSWIGEQWRLTLLDLVTNDCSL